MSSKQKGFTLVEVLAAMVIFAMGAVVLGSSLGGAASAYSWLEERMAAYMVASDKLVEMQVYVEWPEPGTQDAWIERFDRRWSIVTKVSNGPLPNTRRVDIQVGPLSDHGVATHTSHTLSSMLVKPVVLRNTGENDQGG